MPMLVHEAPALRTRSSGIQGAPTTAENALNAHEVCEQLASGKPLTRTERDKFGEVLNRFAAKMDRDGHGPISDKLRAMSRELLGTSSAFPQLAKHLDAVKGAALAAHLDRSFSGGNAPRPGVKELPEGAVYRALEPKE